MGERGSRMTHEAPLMRGLFIGCARFGFGTPPEEPGQHHQSTDQRGRTWSGRGATSPMMEPTTGSWSGVSGERRHGLQAWFTRGPTKPEKKKGSGPTSHVGPVHPTGRGSRGRPAPWPRNRPPAAKQGRDRRSGETGQRARGTRPAAGNPENPAPGKAANPRRRSLPAHRASPRQQVSDAPAAASRPPNRGARGINFAAKRQKPNAADHTTSGWAVTKSKEWVSVVWSSDGRHQNAGRGKPPKRPQRGLLGLSAPTGAPRDPAGRAGRSTVVACSRHDRRGGTASKGPQARPRWDPSGLRRKKPRQHGRACRAIRRRPQAALASASRPPDTPGALKRGKSHRHDIQADEHAPAAPTTCLNWGIWGKEESMNDKKSSIRCRKKAFSPAQRPPRP
ncbi:MAG: hypothetical protein CM15mP18_2880 [Methanobacteriota archaeon]|nr:MAG: hypothetical protein CM15mP18_2880 [Euryarchaeota archaeon]